ncbi:MAG: hypothetical protein KIT84_14985 [Labilithrix sp.]|nr:hypothetical protein [Labilithrix sp.]MCW5812328.1 hypothetical protein [Labilithrix sp.]
MAVQGTIVRRPAIARLAGVALVGCSLYLLKSGVIDVLAAARRHEEAVSFSLGRTAAAPLFLLMSVLVLVASFAPASFNQRMNHAFRDPATGKRKPAAIVFSLLLAAISLGFALWVRATIRGYGYDV